MNKKGQFTMGIILITFISILVGVILFQTVAQQEIGRASCRERV